MANAYRALTADRIGIGERLPELRVPVTATTVVQGAAASRDWQPQHHDSAWAKRVGAKDIFLNTPTQGGWISRFITDWAGPTARLARIAYRMRVSIHPGDTMVISGVVGAVHTDRTGCCWVDVAVEVRVGDTRCTLASVTVALPAAVGAEIPWRRGPERWLVAELPPFAEPAP
jgi:acyl dehydratase